MAAVSVAATRRAPWRRSSFLVASGTVKDYTTFAFCSSTLFDSCAWRGVWQVTNIACRIRGLKPRISHEEWVADFAGLRWEKAFGGATNPDWVSRLGVWRFGGLGLPRWQARRVWWAAEPSSVWALAGPALGGLELGDETLTHVADFGRTAMRAAPQTQRQQGFACEEDPASLLAARHVVRRDRLFSHA